jgi:undecaprenyl-diphosphatase
VTLFHIVVLAVIQGITEFLPISSSGHLALAPQIAGWPDQGLMMDVAVHVGTLGAVVAYLWRDLWGILCDLPWLAAGRVEPGAWLLFYLFIASLPVAAAGYALNQYGVEILRSATVIGWSFLGFGVLLYLSDRLGLRVRRLEHMSVVNALYIGVAQAFALIPGASRAGTTITMARMLGYERREAARFSMLLAIPAILGAGLLQGAELVRSGDTALQMDALMAAGLAFVTALFAIAAMMGWLRRASFTPFVVYRVIAGIAILIWAYGG